MRQAALIVLTPEEKAKLEQLLNNPKTQSKLLERVKIVLLAAMGHNNEAVANILKFSAARVGKWRSRFAERRLKGIVTDAPRQGRPPKVREGMTKLVLEKTLTEPPPDQRKFWSSRLLAKALGISHTSVHRIWRANSVSPKGQPLAIFATNPKNKDKLEELKSESADNLQ
jgi:putative transposase